MFKREISTTWFTAVTAVYFVTVVNWAFWKFVWNNLDLSGSDSLLFALSMPIVLFLIFYAMLSLIVWPYVGKAIISVLLILSAAANYFMVKLNVQIDSEMMRNVFESKPHEALEMVTIGGIGWVVVFGILPVAILVWLRIRFRPLWKEIAFRGLHILVALVLLAGMAFLFYKDYASAGRNNRSAGRYLTPFNYISSTSKCIKKLLNKNRPFVVIDEHPEHVPYEDPYYTVLIIMVGETARAMNFSVNGYERETNPKLSRQDIVNFPNVISSGTATAFSLPCMFSHLPREKFDIDASYSTENLMDVMQKAGYDVLWLDNDGGSKGVSTRVPSIDLMKDGNPKFRNGETFFDEVLLDGLEERLANIQKDTVIVLHMMGSHGPSYYRRYPDSFRVFTPTCDTAEIQSHPREEIVNTYDNTILYTDHVISETIDILKRFPQYEAGMIFVSDHGESLGENGMYLHGFPYSLAPNEQVHIPMLLWMSETMRREDHVDYEKLKAAADSMKLSHDNLFHSILGLVEIDSDLYDPGLDLFKPFRTKKLPFRTGMEHANSP
ncbi:MAG: phosphoethanolamine--lipid A transferase [Planctomycetaceae bacterium]|nr:phosphoethanolamine--lipid A transferase [Planctomycetaceae bacterium]